MEGEPLGAYKKADAPTSDGKSDGAKSERVVTGDTPLATAVLTCTTANGPTSS